MGYELSRLIDADRGGRTPFLPISRRVIARAVAAALLAIPLLMAASAEPVFAAYYDNCQLSGYQGDLAYIARGESTQDLTGALADVDMRSVNPCTENGSYADQTGVPIGVQYNSTDPNRIVQLGYARCGETPKCNDIPKDGNNHFWYTKSDTGGGLGYLADGWYKAPIIGHRYRLKVEATTHNGSNVWQYCIKDTTAGESYVCHFENRTWTYGLIAWWGTENHNVHSQNGTRFIDADINLDAQYKKNGLWSFRDGSDNVCLKSPGLPSYYGCLVASDTRTLWSYTFDH